jgi:hypothetical protein
VDDTPTLAVCGATGLPMSAPTEFRLGRSGGNPSSLLTEAWNALKMALAAPIGATQR